MKVVKHVGDIDEKFIQKLLEAKHQHLVLCSRGGDCDLMCAALDLLRGRAWVTEALGACMSAAVPIIASGEKGNRMALVSTRFMAHVPKVHFFSSNDAEDLELEKKELLRYEEIYCAVLGGTTKKSATWWRDRIKGKKDFYFSAKEAVKLGVVDRIV